MDVKSPSEATDIFWNTIRHRFHIESTSLGHIGSSAPGFPQFRTRTAAGTKTLGSFGNMDLQNATFTPNLLHRYTRPRGMVWSLKWSQAEDQLAICALYDEGKFLICVGTFSTSVPSTFLSFCHYTFLLQDFSRRIGTTTRDQNALLW